MSTHTLRNWRVALALVGMLALAPLAGCTVEQSEAGQMPDVNVDAEGGNFDVDLPEVDVDVDPGNMPEFDVDWVELDIFVEEAEVTVPKVDVYTEKETVRLPKIDIDWPGEYDEPEDQVLEVELDVADPNARVEIEEVYAYQNNLMVVARLHATGNGMGEHTTVRDRVAINAPDMDVDYFVIGDADLVDADGDVRVITSTREIDAELQRARKIYGR